MPVKCRILLPTWYKMTQAVEEGEVQYSMPIVEDTSVTIATTPEKDPSVTIATPTDTETHKTGRARRKERKLKNEPSSVLLDNAPDSIQVFDFVTARAKEFTSMLHAVENKGGAKRTFQKLPRHLRRRAMSFNVRRLPRRLRDMATKEVRIMF